MSELVTDRNYEQILLIFAIAYDAKFSRAEMVKNNKSAQQQSSNQLQVQSEKQKDNFMALKSLITYKY